MQYDVYVTTETSYEQGLRLLIDIEEEFGSESADFMTAFSVFLEEHQELSSYPLILVETEGEKYDTGEMGGLRSNEIEEIGISGRKVAFSK